MYYDIVIAKDNNNQGNYGHVIHYHPGENVSSLQIKIMKHYSVFKILNYMYNEGLVIGIFQNIFRLYKRDFFRCASIVT